MLVRLHLSADKCDSCLPSVSLYFNIYFAPTDAAMFQNIQQFHSYQFLQAFSYIIYNEKQHRYMRILFSELSQLKRIVIIKMSLAIVFVKVALISVIS